MGNIYIALDVDQIFVWNTESQSYVQQSCDAYIIQQLQTNIASAQMALQNLQNYKLDKPTLLSSGNVPKWNSTANNFVGGSIYNTDDGKIGILKTIPTEALDVGGRTKSDGIVINETSSAILPKEIKFKDGKFKAALTDGVEKSVLLEGDVASDSNILIDYTHTSNMVLQPTSIDYTTGYVTVPNHGLTSERQIILVPNDYSVNNFAPSSMKYIPYEYIVSNVIRRVIVIDANTLKLVYNWQNISPTVNPSSTENLNNLDVSKWHIEVFTQNEILFNIPNNNIKKISIDATGWGYTEVSSWGVSLGLWVNGVSTSNNLIMNIYPINNNLYFLFFHKIELSVFNGINPQFLSGGFIRRTSGASAYPYTANNIGAYDWNTKFNVYTDNNGISVLCLFRGLMGGIGAGGFRPANGTNVKIYKI